MNYNSHGFLRSRDGTLTTIDAPSVCQTSNGTFVAGINSAGLIVGSYTDASCAHFHGFLRAPDGTFMAIDFPGAEDSGFQRDQRSGGDRWWCVCQQRVRHFLEGAKRYLYDLLCPGGLWCWGNGD